MNEIKFSKDAAIQALKWLNEKLNAELKQKELELENLKKIIAKELSENDEFGSEFVIKQILENKIQSLSNKLAKYSVAIKVLREALNDAHNELYTCGQATVFQDGRIQKENAIHCANGAKRAEEALLKCDQIMGKGNE